MLVRKDGFIYKVVSYETAKVLFSSGALDLFELHDDDSESLIESIDEINQCAESDKPIGISVGMIESDTCKEVLEERGFYTDNLWHTDDVKGKFECDDEQAHEVLKNAFRNDATYEQIWMSIDCAGESLGLTKIEEE